MAGASVSRLRLMVADTAASRWHGAVLSLLGGMEAAMSDREDAPTPHAVRACAEWLATCLRLGWSRDALDALEKLWWEHHDPKGVLR